MFGSIERNVNYLKKTLAIIFHSDIIGQQIKLKDGKK